MPVLWSIDGPTLLTLGFPLLLVAYGVPLGLYIKERNDRVPDSAKVMTPAHIQGLIIRGLARIGIHIAGKAARDSALGPPIRFIGKSMPRRDIPLKVNGTAVYGIDVNVPGMVYASARHSPVAGGAAQSWNDAKIKSMKGVLGTVKLPDGVAVIADSIPHALAARRALEVKWQPGKAAGWDSFTVW